MNEFIEQFGIDWKLFASQLVNFALILVVLRLFVYKPLIKIMNKRKDKIEEGLAKAQEAGIRLKEVDEMAKEKLKETDEKCVALLSQTDVRKKELEQEAVAQAKKKEEELLKKAVLSAENQKKQMYEKIQKEAKEIIRSAIAQGIGEKPNQVDDALVKKAAEALKNEL